MTARLYTHTLAGVRCAKGGQREREKKTARKTQRKELNAVYSVGCTIGRLERNRASISLIIHTHTHTYTVLISKELCTSKKRRHDDALGIEALPAEPMTVRCESGY